MEKNKGFKKLTLNEAERFFALDNNCIWTDNYGDEEDFVGLIELCELSDYADDLYIIQHDFNKLLKESE